VLGERRRMLREEQIVRGLIVSATFDLIPKRARDELDFEWHPERCGAVLASSGYGWLHRELCPGLLRKNSRTTFVPLFALISGERPLLVEWAGAAKATKPEEYVVRRLLGPYVRVLSYLVFVEGIYPELHSQNVLYEVNDEGSGSGPTGRLALRDMSDTSVNLALRKARGLALPKVAGVNDLTWATNEWVSPTRRKRRDARDARDARGWITMTAYGEEAAVWAIATVMKKHVPRFNHDAVVTVYRRMWQRAAMAYLGLEPEIQPLGDRRGMAIDEAIAAFVATKTRAN